MTTTPEEPAPLLTPAALAKYVKADASVDGDYLGECVDEAEALILNHTRTAIVPGPVLKRAALEVAADLYYRRRSRNGVVEFDGDEGAPIRISRDPMSAAYAILRPWVGGGIA